MPSPFPGMDPYLEDPAIWPSVHHNLVGEIQALLNQQLRPRYYAAVEERVYLTSEEDPGRKLERIPDVRLTDVTAAQRKDESSLTVATLQTTEPIPIVVLDDEIDEPYLEIVDVATKEVITIVEALSPSNKVKGSDGRRSFLAKKRQVLNSAVHWVEIDLLRTGARFAARPSVTTLDYLVYVSRVNDERHDLHWPILLQWPLPVIQLPLRKPDPDAPLNLQAVLDSVYVRGSYDLRFDYRADPVPPLTGANADWARQWLQSKGLR